MGIVQKDLLASARRRPFWKTVFLENCFWTTVFAKPLWENCFWKTAVWKTISEKPLVENGRGIGRPSCPSIGRLIDRVVFGILFLENRLLENRFWKTVLENHMLEGPH